MYELEKGTGSVAESAADAIKSEMESKASVVCNGGLPGYYLLFNQAGLFLLTSTWFLLKAVDFPLVCFVLTGRLTGAVNPGAVKYFTTVKND